MKPLQVCSRRILLSVIVIGINLCNIRAQTYVHRGNISGRWSAAGSPYMIQGNVTIPVKNNLIIEKGVIIQFVGYFSLTIRGSMHAEGTSLEPILFTFAKDTADTVSARQLVDGWRGIRVVGCGNTKDTTILNQCRIEKTRVMGGSNEECLGGAIHLDSSCYAIVQNSTITNNQAHIGAALYSSCSRCDINRVIVTQNNALSDGGAFCFINSKITLNNSIVSKNTSEGNGGAVFSYGGSLTLINTVMSGNTARFGGAMALDKTSVSIINNTIAENTAAMEGAAIHSMCSQPRIVNTIIYNNHSRKNEQMYLFMNAGYNIQNTCIQGGLRGIDGLLYADSLLVSNEVSEEDPLFDANESVQYALGKESRCIDAGINDTLYHIPHTDIRGIFRESNGPVDLGAYEYVEDTITEEAIELLTEDDDTGLGDKDNRFMLFYPNPNRGSFTIEFLNSEETPASIVICNIGGQKLYEQTLDNMQNTGYLEINTGLPDGIYSLQVYGVGNKLLESWKLIIAL